MTGGPGSNVTTTAVFVDEVYASPAGQGRMDLKSGLFRDGTDQMADVLVAFDDHRWSKTHGCPPNPKCQPALTRTV